MSLAAISQNKGLNPSSSSNALQKSPSIFFIPLTLIIIAKVEKPSIVANISYNSDDNDSNAAYVMMEVDHKKKIKEISGEFDEMIKFMDTSFEKAFDKKEKDFMLAYRVSSN